MRLAHAEIIARLRAGELPLVDMSTVFASVSDRRRQLKTGRRADRRFERASIKVAFWCLRLLRH